MESGCFEAIRAYLSGRILGYNAEIALVKSRNGVFIRLYLESNDLEDGLINAAAEIIFSGQDKDLKSFYLEKYGLPYTLEAKLILTATAMRYVLIFLRINYAALMLQGLWNPV